MALTKTFSEFVYKSQSGTETYYFTITMDEQQNVAVKNIVTPTGISTSTSLVPKSISTDIQTAIGQVETLVAQTSAINGMLVFSSEVTKAVVFASAFANTNYRVTFSTEDFIPVRLTSKTVNGFTVEVGVTYTGSIGYDVFV